MKIIKSEDEINGQDNSRNMWRLIITMILKQRESRKCLYRIISLLLKKEFSEDFIFRSIFRRTSWYV